MYKVLTICLLTILGCVCFSCKKDRSDIEKEDPKKDKWVSRIVKDSTGNQYMVAATYDNKLQIRVQDTKGATIFSGDCPSVDSSEIPASGDKVSIELTAPNKYINSNDASLAIGFSKGEYANTIPYVQLLANISLDTKKFYTKKYKVEDEWGWGFVSTGGGVVQWYQNSILVREGAQRDLNGGGFMGLGQRGTQLVCYNRDFSIRYTKDIDVNAANYPGRGGLLIPINDMKGLAFVPDRGYLQCFNILVSVEDQWSGVKPEVWAIDLKQIEKLPADYSVKITDYNVTGILVNTTYTIYDGSGKQVETKTRDWDVNTGAPRTKLNP